MVYRTPSYCPGSCLSRSSVPTVMGLGQPSFVKLLPGSPTTQPEDRMRLVHCDHDLPLVIRCAKMTESLAPLAQSVGTINDGSQLSGFEALVQVRQVLVLSQANQTDGLVCGLLNPPAENHKLK